jgi:hypothetical protein
MAKIVTAVFDDPSNAQLAVQDLVNHGIFREDISVQATQGTSGREFCVDVSSKAPEGGVIGTVGGIVLGAAAAYLMHAGYITIPGIDLAHHSLLMCALAGTAAGSMGGLLMGLLVGWTMPEYESNLYPVDERNGRILLGVYCNEKREGEIRTLLQAASGTTLRSRSVATEPIRLHTTAIDHNRFECHDDMVSRAVHASESELIRKRLQSAKTNLSKIMESISQLESELGAHPSTPAAGDTRANTAESPQPYQAPSNTATGIGQPST